MQETGPAAEGHAEPGPETPVPAWKARVEAEYNDLTDKINRLGAVLDAKAEGSHAEIDPVQHTLMIAQHGAMVAYQAILFLRLNTETR